jgi:hypothetical protein
MSHRRLPMAALLAWTLASTLLASVGACGQRDPFPERIESLAVLPVEITPSDGAAGSVVAGLLGSALLQRTSFRVVPLDSVSRLRMDPRYERVFARFRGLARGGGVVEPEVSQALGDRTGVRGLVWTTLSLGLASQVRGDISLTVRIYDARTGRPVWRAFRRHPFEGTSADPAFARVMTKIIGEVVRDLPRPEGEIEP